MVRAATQIVIVVGLLSHHFPLAGQNNLPASEASHAGSNLLVGSGESKPRTFEVEGKITSVAGEPLEGAKVWVAYAASPTQHLATTQADSNGDYVLKVLLPLQTGRTNFIVVGANNAEYAEARELRDLSGPEQTSKTNLLLPRVDESLEAPNLYLIQAWLLPRLVRAHDCRGQQQSGCRTLRESLARFRKQPPDWVTLEQILGATRQSDIPQLHLLAAFALTRMGSWQGAGTMLDSEGPAARASEEEYLLRAVRASFLRRPEEARQDLVRARALDPRNPLIDLELGRAAVQMEDWPTAAARLDRPLRQRDLAPDAHYLRARAMIALGDFGGASIEAGVLVKDLRRKRLSPEGQSFVNDLQTRLQERSTQPLENVIKQPAGELQQAVGELNDLNPSSPQPPGGLEEFLKQVGTGVEETFRDLSNTVASEVIRQTQLDRSGKARTARSLECNYIFVHRTINGHIQADEYRGNKEGQPLSPGKTEGGFMVTSGFVSSLMIFHPEFQPQTTYRFLGSQSLAGQSTYVIAFAQKPDSPSPMGRFVLTLGNVTALYLQGIAWISSEHRVLRLRTDLLHPVDKISLSHETSEIDYRPYHFLSSPVTFFLPNRVIVNVEWGRKRLRNEHLFSKFQLFGVEVHEDSATSAPTLDAAHQTFRINPDNDNVHVNRGLALDNKGDLEAAIGEYREAVRLNANNDLAHYNLGMALDDKGELEGAIGEYRAALRLDPDNENAHLNLGSALFKRGEVDAAIAEYRAGLRLNPDNDSAHYNLGVALGAKGTFEGAVTETRAALRLDPNNPQLHYSLAYWLEKMGDRNKALGEYRVAHALKPDNSQFKRAYERLARKPKSRPASGPNERRPTEGV
jgi:tetratricopeptide (TPR) repeat protein